MVPLQCEFFALEGLSQLLSTVESVKQTLNADLTIHGIVLTMYDPRNNLATQVAADVRGFMGSKVYETIIPAQRADFRGAVVWEAGASLRSQMRWQPGLSAAGFGSDPARTAIARGVITESRRLI